MVQAVGISESVFQVVQKFAVLFLDGFELLDYLLAFGGETGAAATLAACQTINQRIFRQVVDQIDRIPGSLIADADCLGGLGNRTKFVDLFQKVDPVSSQEFTLLAV